MRRRGPWIAVVLLALGFGLGLYVANRAGSDDTDSTAPAAATPGTTAPAPTTAAPTVAPTAPTKTTVEKPRPAFAVAPLSGSQRAQLKARGVWHRGCPVPLSGLRLLTITYQGFDRQAHSGQVVVNASVAHPLKRVFRRLYRKRFPIRHASFAEVYGPRSARPKDGDVTGSFECRQAVPSPCTGGLRSGHWSMHAYGMAVDVNPTENPYVGCGQSHDPATKPFRDRTRHRRGMIDQRAIAAFASVGWGWGGSWTGNTKDYMHFSSTGH